MRFIYGSPVGPIDQSLPLPPPVLADGGPVVAPDSIDDEQKLRLKELQRAFPFVPAAATDVLLLIPTQAPVHLLLNRLAAAKPLHRLDLQGSVNVEGGSGGELGRFLEIGSWFLKTSLDRSFERLDQAMSQEMEQERIRRRLRIYQAERLWFLSRGTDGRIWACSLTPRLLTLRELFNQTGGDDQCWKLFLKALSWTLELLERWNVVLDCNPNNFGIGEQRLYYLDDDLMSPCGHVAWVTQALLRLREYPRAAPELRRAFVLGIRDLLQEHPSEKLKQWGLIDDLDHRELWPPEPEIRQILENLLNQLRSTRRKGKR